MITPILTRHRSRRSVFSRCGQGPELPYFATVFVAGCFLTLRRSAAYTAVWRTFSRRSPSPRPWPWPVLLPHGADTAAAERTRHPRGLRQRRRRQRQAVTGLDRRRLRRPRGQRRRARCSARAGDRAVDDRGHRRRQPGVDHAIQFIRDGLAAFFKKLDGKAQIALSTYGERPTPLVEYTDSTAQLQKGIGRLFAQIGRRRLLARSAGRALERHREAGSETPRHRRRRGRERAPSSATSTTRRCSTP